MKKILLSAVLFCISLMANAQCTAVATFNETFANFTNGVLPQNCWTGSTGSPKLSVVASGADKALQLYGFMTPTVPFYVVSPELTAIDGNNKVTFSSQYITGSATGGIMTIQVGTLATATDYASFQVIATTTVSTVNPTFSTVVPASAHKFVAFKIVADIAHTAATIDNIVYEPNLSVVKSELNSFTVYPNPSVDRNVTISYNNSLVANEKNSVAVYSLAGAKVFETQMQENTQTVNLSELASGIYILKLQSGSNVATKKLILK